MAKMHHPLLCGRRPLWDRDSARRAPGHAANSRRLWRWHTGGKDKGVSLSAVALTGIDASKSTVEPVLPEITLLDALEIILASDAAAATIEAA